MTAYSAEIIEQANEYPRLGAEYFAARDAAERFMAHWKEEHAEQFAEAILKPVMDLVTERVWDAFRDHLMMDTQSNIHTEMQRMVENSVAALIGGDKWANVKYISPEGYRTEKVRETLAKLYSDEIKDGRIADLEKKIEALEQSLRWARGDRS
jgi:type I site-specific restriction endonuclease